MSSAAADDGYAELPADPDAQVVSSSSTDRPAHLRLSLVALVILGGAIGATIREAIVLGVPVPHGSFPWPTGVVNIVGAFILGVLLEGLARRGPDAGRRRAARLFFGTGVLGGFTTYSALAVDTYQLLGSPLTAGIGVLYGLGSAVFGVVAAFAGVRVAQRFVRRGAGAT